MTTSFRSPRNLLLMAAIWLQVVALVPLGATSSLPAQSLNLTAPSAAQEQDGGTCASEAAAQNDDQVVEHDERFPIRAVTFNIRFNNAGDGENAWPRRKDWVAELLLEKQPDVIGLQEVLVGQFRDLQTSLNGYEAKFVGRDAGDERGEGCPIFYRTDRFEAVSQETYWLSETPEQKGSRGWDAALPRVVTHLQLKDKQAGTLFHVFNTHFDHQGDEARQQSGLLLHRLIKEKAGDERWVAMGDLNASPDSKPLQNLLTGATQEPAFVDARRVAEEKLGPDSTWNGFRAVVAERRIDFIIVAQGVAVPRVEIDAQSREGRFPSDHLPVIADLHYDAR